MIRLLRLTSLAVACGLILGLTVTAQDPPKKDGNPDPGKKDPRGFEGKGKGGFDGRGKGGLPGRPGGPGGFPGTPDGFPGFGRMAPAKPGTVLSPAIQDFLKISAEQKKELDELQKMVDERLAKILTADQLKQLKEMGERGPGGFGRPGFGGPGGPGGPGIPGGPFPPRKKDN